MVLKLYKGLWGMTEPLEECLIRIKDAGYDGFECNVPDTDEEMLEIKALAEKYDLTAIPKIKTDPPCYAETFRVQLQRAQLLNPPIINSHTGRDSMTEAELDDLFTKVMALEKECPIPVAHETHRSRPTYAPWSTHALLEKFPDMHITADFSHWCCVCETLLEDQKETLQLPIERTRYIHARVGFEQGPQVPDPAAPEYAAAEAAHVAWWRAIAKNLKDSGAETLHIMVEYGPPAYQHTIPYTNQPVSSAWDVSLWTMKRLREVLKEYVD